MFTHVTFGSAADLNLTMGGSWNGDHPNFLTGLRFERPICTIQIENLSGRLRLSCRLLESLYAKMTISAC